MFWFWKPLLLGLFQYIYDVFMQLLFGVPLGMGINICCCCKFQFNFATLSDVLFPLQKTSFCSVYNATEALVKCPFGADTSIEYVRLKRNATVQLANKSHCFIRLPAVAFQVVNAIKYLNESQGFKVLLSILPRGARKRSYNCTRHSL